METQFICTHRPTVRSVAEQSRKMQPVKTYASMLLGICFFAYILYRAISFQFQGMWILLLALSTVYMVYLAALPEINAWQSIRRAKKQLGEEPCSTVYFADLIRITQGDMELTWEYSQIRYVRKFRRSLLLINKESLGISVDPNGFTQGDFDGFMAFIREKCPDANFPK